MPCKNCGTLALNEFYETQTSAYCKSCHKQKYFGAGRLRLLNAKLERRACVDCDMIVTAENLCVFEFDHLRDKRYNVSAMTTMSDEKFHTEIAKCELRCANCHRLATRTRGYSTKGGRPRKIPVTPYESISSTPAPF